MHTNNGQILDKTFMKSKNHLSERLASWQFLMLFTMSSALTMGAGIFFRDSLMIAIAYLPIQLLVSMMLVIPLIFKVIGEALVLKFQLNWSAHKWMIASFLGILLLLLWHIFSFNSNSTPLLTMSWIVERSPLTILGIAQFVVLRRYVKRAWLWIIAGGIVSLIDLPLSSMVYSLFGSDFMSSNIGRAQFAALFGTIQGIILGTTMIWLVRFSVKVQRQQIEADSALDDNVAHLQNGIIEDDDHMELEQMQFQDIASSR